VGAARDWHLDPGSLRERAARAAGFARLEIGATLSGVPFCRAQGYAALENLQVRLNNGEMLAIVTMAKEIKRKF
jgi:hypothetical protein